MNLHSSGFKNWNLGDYRFQIYYPEFIFRGIEIFLRLPTCLRIIPPQFRSGIRIHGFAIEIFGFGIGYDYEKGYYDTFIKPYENKETPAN